jgi:antitoxin component YwqK of YwqJK toxin-antitoxin module
MRILILLVIFSGFTSFYKKNTLFAGAATSNLFGWPQINATCQLQSRINMDNGNKYTSLFTYDAAGLLDTIENTGNNKNKITSIVYNAAGRIETVMNFHSGRLIKLFYNPSGIVEKLTVLSEKSPCTVEVSYPETNAVQCRRYDVGNNLEGVFTSYFDDKGNLIKTIIEQNTPDGLQVVMEYEFEYDTDILNPYLSLGDLRFIIILLCDEELLSEGAFNLASNNVPVSTISEDRQESTSESSKTQFYSPNTNKFPEEACLRFDNEKCGAEYFYSYTCK